MPAPTSTIEALPAPAAVPVPVPAPLPAPLAARPPRRSFGRRVLRGIWRMVLGTFALMLAIPFGSFVLAGAVLSDPLSRGWLFQTIRAGITSGFWSFTSTLSPEVMLLALSGTAKLLAMLLFLPPLLTALIGETLRIRAIAWYGGATGLITSCLPWILRGGSHLPTDKAVLAGEGRIAALLFIAGAASGLVYWLIAGRGAGPNPVTDLRHSEAG